MSNYEILLQLLDNKSQFEEIVNYVKLREVVTIVTKQKIHKKCNFKK